MGIPAVVVVGILAVVVVGILAAVVVGILAAVGAILEEEAADLSLQ
ncbi:MAG: hypothetical protein ACPGQC_07960 [Limisphaerales bacterium]